MYFLVYKSEKNRKKRAQAIFFTIFITICLMFDDGGRIMNFLSMCAIIKGHGVKLQSADPIFSCKYACLQA